MSAVITRNPPVDQPVPDPPRRPTGGLFTFSLCYDAGKYRAYADTAGELVDALIPGYLQADPQGRLEQRLEYAVRCQVTLQATVVAANPELFQECTPAQRDVLLSSRAAPPLLAGDWSAPLPLYLVSSFHAPIGLTPRPAGAGAGEVLWIDPSTDHELLISLHHTGLVTMATRDEAPGGV